jgi:hypothetical protein
VTVVALDAAPVRVRAANLLPATVFLLVAGVVWWASVPYVVGVFHDDGVYALLAKAIATGQGYHYLGLPGNPAATHQPPLYPLLLAGAWWLAPSFPDNLSVLLGLNALLLGLVALGLYRFATLRLAWRRDAAAVFGILATINAPMLTLASVLLSEPLFLAALLPLLLLAESAATRDDASGVRLPALTGAAIGLLMLVRTHAIALLLAFLLVLLLQRRWREAAAAAGAAVVVQLPWQLWTMSAAPVPAPLEGAYGSYLGWYATGLREGGAPFLVATARENLREFWLLLLDRVAVGSYAWIRICAAAGLAGFILAGWYAAVRRAPVTALFVAGYLGIVLVWPFVPWRFVWAVWPLVLLLAAEGGRRMLVGAWPLALRASIAAAAVLVAVTMFGAEWAAYRERSWLRPAQEAGEQIKPIVRWVATRTRPDDVVMTEGAEIVTLFTGRRATPAVAFTAREYLVPPTVDHTRTQLRAMLDAVPAQFVVAPFPLTQAAARGLTTTRPGLREIGGLASGAALFEVVR